MSTNMLSKLTRHLICVAISPMKPKHFVKERGIGGIKTSLYKGFWLSHRTQLARAAHYGAIYHRGKVKNETRVYFPIFLPLN